MTANRVVCRFPQRMMALLAAATLSLAAVPAARSSVASATSQLAHVIVMGTGVADAEASVLEANGKIDEKLPIINGVSARVPSSSLSWLSSHENVVADRTFRPAGASYSDNLASAYPAQVGATTLWNSGNAGNGIGVALVDTGIADVPDVHNRVVARADLSGEGDGIDHYGHGTFLAGLIAGDGTSSNGRYVGVAPQANLVSIKVAGADGSTSLSKVLMGIQTAHEMEHRFNIHVLVLALSSESPLPPDLDPLSYALRKLWSEGVLVVVPAGNNGPAAGSITSPGEDPVLLTAGSVNDNGSTDVSADTVSDWSGRGPTRWGDPKPDLAAPGEHLISLRDPGSTVDVENPGSVVDGAYFRGSGTSMATAVTAGAAALLFAAQPGLDSDQAKAMLMGSANPTASGTGDSIGAGVVNAADAAALNPPTDLPDAPHGSEVGRFASEQQALDWAGRSWARDSWDARQWEGRQWSARSWAARQWAYAQWLGRQWSSRSWAGSSWGGRSWDGSSWGSRQWSGSSWGGRSWTGSSWAARQWSARSWSADEWSSRQWSGQQWSGSSWASRQWSSRSWS
ncbi:MAG: S8 family serine peptidase [Actinomycetota bacterium]